MRRDYACRKWLTGTSCIGVNLSSRCLDVSHAARPTCQGAICTRFEDASSRRACSGIRSSLEHQLEWVKSGRHKLYVIIQPVTWRGSVESCVIHLSSDRTHYFAHLPRRHFAPRPLSNSSTHCCLSHNADCHGCPKYASSFTITSKVLVKVKLGRRDRVEQFTVAW